MARVVAGARCTPEFTFWGFGLGHGQGVGIFGNLYMLAVGGKLVAGPPGTHADSAARAVWMALAHDNCRSVHGACGWSPHLLGLQFRAPVALPAR